MNKVSQHATEWIALGPYGLLALIGIIVLLLIVLCFAGLMFLRFRKLLYSNGHNGKFDKLYNDFYQHKLYVAKELGEIKGNVKVLIERSK